MSDYVRKKAVRYRFSPEEVVHFTELAKANDDYDIYDYFERIIPKEKRADFCRVEKPGFEVDSGIAYAGGSYKCERYLDFVLDDEYGACCGEFGKSRGLYPEESDKYVPMFKEFLPDITADRLRLVEFCYYNGGDAEACFDPTDDPFNKSTV